MLALRIFYITFICILSVVNCNRSSEVLIAEAEIHIHLSTSVIGKVTFTQSQPDGPVRVHGTLRNLIPNTRYHGFHVHMSPLAEGVLDCQSTGLHFNPFDTKHGDRLDSLNRRHVGDLGNIWSDTSGVVTIDFEDQIIQLQADSKRSILNKALVIHRDEDDLGRGSFDDSHTTGHAGARIACGNIVRVNQGSSKTTSSQSTSISWSFDLNTDDDNGNFHGIPINNPTYVPSPVSQTAIHLQSSLRQSVAVQQPKLQLNRTSFTVETWIYPISLSTYDNTIYAQCQNPNPEQCIHFSIRNSVLFMNYFRDTLKGVTTLKSNAWYHVAFVVDSSKNQILIYLNGKLESTKSTSSNNPGTSDIITIGSSRIAFHQTFFDGYIDQLIVTLGAKSASEILKSSKTLQSKASKTPPVASEFCADAAAIFEDYSKRMEDQTTFSREALRVSMETLSTLKNERIHSNSVPVFEIEAPNRVWCPWKADCTQILRQRGKATIEMDQNTTLPFELVLSGNEKSTNETYMIELQLSHSLAKISKIKNGVRTVIAEGRDEDTVLQQKASKYWLSIDYSNLFIKYGQGETRDLCTLLKCEISENERELLRSVQYAHISFNHSREVASLKQYEDKVRLKIGNEPVIVDPPLLVVKPDQYQISHWQNNTATWIGRLNSHCQALFYEVTSWKFQDEDFPQLYEAIEHSVRTPSGWCNKRLREKSTRFGTPNLQVTYLRITVGMNRGTSPGVPYVLEIWPPGHYSPIHAHANTNGIIRVLYGEIHVKLYRSLDPAKTVPIREATVHEGDVTWLSPGFNQIHKLENLSKNQSCITIQAYEYVADDISNYEFFDYIKNDGVSIGKFNPVSDMDFHDFKTLMKEEWYRAHQNA